MAVFCDPLSFWLYFVCTYSVSGTILPLLFNYTCRYRMYDHYHYFTVITKMCCHSVLSVSSHQPERHTLVKLFGVLVVLCLPTFRCLPMSDCCHHFCVCDSVLSNRFGFLPRTSSPQPQYKSGGSLHCGWYGVLSVRPRILFAGEKLKPCQKHLWLGSQLIIRDIYSFCAEGGQTPKVKGIPSQGAWQTSSSFSNPILSFSPECSTPCSPT